MEAGSEITQRIKAKDVESTERKKSSRAAPQNIHQPVIKAGEVDTKSLHYHEKNIAFKIEPGKAIPEVPENTLSLASTSFQQSPLQSTLLEVRKLKADEMHFKKEHGIIKHMTDTSQTLAKESSQKKTKNKEPEEKEKKQKHVQQTVSKESQKSSKYSSVVSMGDAASVKKIKMKVKGPNYYIHREKNSLEDTTYQQLNQLLKKPISLLDVNSSTLSVPIIWNLPALYSNFIGRTKELSEIKMNLGGNSNSCIIQSIAGLGGIGKTQLAVAYCHQSHEQNNYDLIAWLNAETSLLAEYRALGQTVGNPIQNLEDKKQIIDEVKARLADFHKVLLIFDNAADYASIEDYLPTFSSTKGSVCHCLITSRSQHWGSLPDD